MKDIFSKSIMPVRFKRFYDRYKNQEFNFLDVGCEGSLKSTRRYFKRVKYYGIDYRKNEEESGFMDGFFRVDLSKEKLSVVPDCFFDVIMMSHVIEHLRNGLELLPEIVKKLKNGGVMYVEFPSVDSLSLPSAKDVLNFSDEKTHRRIYSIREIANTLLDCGMRVVRAGKRRDFARIILTPILIVRDFIRRGTFGASLWDLLGFAEYVYAVKL